MQLYIHGSRSVEGAAGPVWCEDGRHLITRVIAGGLHACVGRLKWDAKRGTPELFPGAGAGTMLYTDIRTCAPGYFLGGEYLSAGELSSHKTKAGAGTAWAV